MTLQNEQNHCLVTQIWLDNLLSFGPGTPPLAMARLNVLIGPNGAGKSNLIEALALMRATARDVRTVLSRGGGSTEWIWKGNKEAAATIELLVNDPKGRQPLRHLLVFRTDARGAFRLDDERVENESAYPGHSGPYFYYRFERGRPVVNEAKATEPRQLARDTIDPDLSILAQRRDPEIYPEISYVAERYEKIRIYREWAFGRNTVFRSPQGADLRNDRLEEDFSNLGLFLSKVRREPKAKAAILEGLQDLYEGFSDYEIIVEAGTVQVFFTEGEFTIPATRLSDGTLRYLCLLAILCDPAPPPLICIEEPELGLHPDILPKLADHLLAASERTQIIVTTHSDILVDAMTERPEAVVVCEKHDGRTQMRRLRQEDLAVWLEKYRLGQLWTKGQIGGSRW